MLNAKVSPDYADSSFRRRLLLAAIMNTQKRLLPILLLFASGFLSAEEAPYLDEPIVIRPSPVLTVEETRVPGRVTAVTVHPGSGFSYNLVQVGGNGEFEPLGAIPASFTAARMKVPSWTIWSW